MAAAASGVRGYAPQQLDPLDAAFPPQSQLGFVPRRIPLITAAAHPTPAFTRIAPEAQFWAQAPHSMHAPRSTIAALPSVMENTACGQTSTHSRHPLHRAASKDRVCPFLM